MAVDKPKAAKRFETEEKELEELLNRFRFASTGHVPALREQAMTWLDRVLYEHREQAHAEGLKSWGRPTGWKGWWDRNWFGVALLTMIGGSLLVIGFVNGWS